jgi:hypothetical protein
VFDRATTPRSSSAARAGGAEGKVMMPLLGRSLAHSHGAELIHAWLAAMPANDCGGAQAR